MESISHAKFELNWLNVLEPWMGINLLNWFVVFTVVTM